MSTSSCSSKRDSRGAAMVEMAILLSLLVILFVGITELGRALFFQHKLLKSAEAAARYMGRAYGAIDPADCSTDTGWTASTASAANLAVYANTAGSGTRAIPNFDPTDVTFTLEQRDVPDVGTVCVVHVDLAVAYDGLFMGGGGFLPPIILGQAPGGTWTLTASSEERYVGE